MKIFKIEIENFRLLKSFSMDLEAELSLVIGKNNTGKTSILSVFDKFLAVSDRSRFSFDDFNLPFRLNLQESIAASSVSMMDEEEYLTKYNDGPGIRLRVFIDYNEQDNLSNLSRIMMDLDPDNNVVVLEFGYILLYSDYLSLSQEVKKFLSKELAKKEKNYSYEPQSVSDFLTRSHKDYFKIRRKSMSFDPDSEQYDAGTFMDLDQERVDVSDIINFKYINAKREVANKEPNRTLSGQTARIYKKSAVDDADAIEDFQDKLSETDTALTGIYKSLFKKIIDKVGMFGGMHFNETEIEIISSLKHRELLEGNTTVVYKHDGENRLPESYNGLGYLNLISMIFEIEILVNEFKNRGDRKLSDINLLFIEEPEAHTHPQMQYIFIKNIKALLGEGIQKENENRKNLQYIISTHSSYIVADSDFDDIKYLKRGLDDVGVGAKNLKDLRERYDSNPKQYQFLKQYLTINRAEVFFAEKLLLIEGDTERILFPTFMKKLDLETTSSGGEECLPLLSQNISIMEVGAYSQIFQDFIDFLGVKTVIITDIDATLSKEACRVSEGDETSNQAIKTFLGSKSWEEIREGDISHRELGLPDSKSKLLIAYQLSEKDYHARSFEDAFIHQNRGFINSNKDDFRGLKNRRHFEDPEKDAFDLAQDCIQKKTHFALDVIYHSDEGFSNWEIPGYIKEALLWLKED